MLFKLDDINLKLEVEILYDETKIILNSAPET